MKSKSKHNLSAPVEGSTDVHTSSKTDFYPLTLELATKLRQADLTAAEWRLWSYLVTLDPFGDRYQDVDVLTILSECNLSKPTFYRALAKFEEQELFDAQPVRMAIRNLQGARRLLSKNSLKNDTPVSEMRKLSQKRDSSIKNETPVSEMRRESQKRDKPDLEVAPDIDSGTSQTNHIDQTDQTNQTLSDSRPPAKKQERDGDLFDQDGEPIAPYKNWLIKKADKLPNPIGIMELWLEKNARKSALIKAYRQVQKECSAAPSSVDLNSLITDIDAELRRLGWSRDKAIAYMVGANGWQESGFYQLSDRDLAKLLQVLELVEVEEVDKLVEEVET